MWLQASHSPSLSLCPHLSSGTHSSHLLHCPRSSSENKQDRRASPQMVSRPEEAGVDQVKPRASRTSPDMILLPPRGWPCPATPSPNILDKPKISGAAEPSETTATWVKTEAPGPLGGYPALFLLSDRLFTVKPSLTLLDARLRESRCKPLPAPCPHGASQTSMPWVRGPARDSGT